MKSKKEIKEYFFNNQEQLKKLKEIKIEEYSLNKEILKIIKKEKLKEKYNNRNRYFYYFICIFNNFIHNKFYIKKNNL